ncbi:uncharacterized protein LOC128769855 [Synchiropus splendidus]|uniref:uncharacterized protein LOC128769855 n=1 Tax=Synchiropus splendidus TaxID=270530 RepID=UPI00237DA00E|nr:uncharacterized protein LOC128769855 [Synchiropus splendidus]
MALKVHLALCLFLSLTVPASEAETVFVKTGEDLRLAGPGPVDLSKLELFFWRYNRSTRIVRLSAGGEPVIFPAYEGRAEFVKETHSLLVRRVNHGDSGDYTAVIAESEERVVARYRVQVLDPVSPVQLKVVSFSLSEDTYVLNVTWGPITSSFTCYCKTFRLDGGQQEVYLSGSTYRIYHQNSNIICNHSNQVSWTNDTMQILDFCSATAAAPIRWTVVLLWLQLLFVFVGVCLVTGVSCRGRRLKTAAGLSPDSTPDQTQPPPAEETVYELDD